MRRRGLTLVELLLALVLLGSLCSLLTSWLVSVSRLAAEQGPALAWRSAAQRVLDMIGDDLICGDFSPHQRNQKPESKFEVVDNGALRINTRSTTAQDPAHPGSTSHEYHLDANTQSLVLTMCPEGTPGVATNRALLSDVIQWNVLTNEEVRTVTVRIERISGEAVSRRYSWP